MILQEKVKFTQLTKTEQADFELVRDQLQRWVTFNGERGVETIKFRNAIDKIMDDAEADMVADLRARKSAVIDARKQWAADEKEAHAINDVKIVQEIKDMEAALKALGAIQKTEERDERAAKVYERIQEQVNREEIYFIVNDNAYVFWNKKKMRWQLGIQYGAILKKLGIREEYSADIFNEIIFDHKHTKDTMTSTFAQHPDNELNMMRTDGWLQPVEGDYHPIFEMMVKTLTANRPDYQEHLERIIVSKYLKPEEYRIPSVLLFGEKSGGAGKNTFVDRVVRTIFGDAQVSVLKFRDVAGQFNEAQLNKAFIMFDEMTVDKGCISLMKQDNGNRMQSINPKGTKVINVDNTAVRMYVCNGNVVVMVLSGETQDRRYTPMHIRWGMETTISMMSEDQTDEDGSVIEEAVIDLSDKVKYKAPIDWFFEHEAKLSSPVEVGKWLHALLERHRDKPALTQGYHGEDYDYALGAQGSGVTDAIDRVFNDEFIGIDLSAFYEFYQAIMANEYPSSAKAYTKGKKKFREDVDRYIERYSLPIEYKKLKMIGGVQAWGYRVKGARGSFVLFRDVLIDSEGGSNEMIDWADCPEHDELKDRNVGNDLGSVKKQQKLLNP